ncbi:hypothetical protein BJ165DRAFT_1424344 [Panaeolus papilionaceus]|nr:hypothetical protein BJ165DRAFT_1424344 [Panaeolus papilionaceus]
MQIETFLGCLIVNLHSLRTVKKLSNGSIRLRKPEQRNLQRWCNQHMMRLSLWNAMLLPPTQMLVKSVELPTFIEHVAKRKDGPEAMFSKQAARMSAMPKLEANAASS